MSSNSNWRLLGKGLATVAQCAVLVVGLSQTAVAQTAGESPPATASESILLSPPPVAGPVVVRASFQLLSISAIEDEAEKVAFSGVLTLVWKDERQAFDPVKEGVSEKVFSGAYQFNEIAPSWYPQVTLVNGAGQYDSRAIILRVKPDGTSSLSEDLEAVAKVNLDIRRFPFDRQRLELIFRLFGFDAGELVFQEKPIIASADDSLIKVPQWSLEGIDASIRTMNATNSDGMGVASALVVAVDVKRQPLFMLRLVVIPLSVIVMLSWSVFWMDRSSVGDRMAVSFVGLLTAVAYQITLGGIVPNVSYVTLMNGFLNFSFLIMCATVVVNLYVGVADRHGYDRGDRIDRRCRWLFPLTYLGLNAVAVAVAFLFF